MTPGPEDPPLHELDPTSRFSDRAEDYVKYRPGYPLAAIDAILRGLGDPASLTVADIGAGTGIAARQLAARGARLIAVEPNPDMRAAAAPHPRIEWREGTAESTRLGEASVDLVVCAQAFHWFRPAAALAEFRRILRPRGRLVLLWNNRDRDDALTRGYIEAIHAVNGEHPAERRAFDPELVHRDGGFTPARLERYAHDQELDRDGLVGRALSASYVPRTGEPHAALLRLLGALFERHHDAHGRLRLRYVTNVWNAERT